LSYTETNVKACTLYHHNTLFSKFQKSKGLPIGDRCSICNQIPLVGSDIQDVYVVVILTISDYSTGRYTRHGKLKVKR